LYTDSVTRLNRITTALTRHLASLESYEKRFSEIDAQQKILRRDINKTKESLESDAHARIQTAIPEIAAQNRMVENMEKRVDTARRILAEQSDMVITFTDETNSSWQMLITKLMRIGE
jgi:chromosome segregation ATPase